MESLYKFKKFVDEINKENGRLYKQSVLKKYKDDEDIKYYLNFIFNPYIITGLSEKKLERFHLNSCIDDYTKNKFIAAKEALEYIKTHNTGRYEDIDEMFSFYMNCFIYDSKQLIELGYDTCTRDIFEKLLKKDFSLGIDTKTINKVIPKLIPEFNVQLANKYFEDPERIEGKEFAITTKIDGGRIIAIKENGKVIFYTRQGQLYDGLVDLEEEMKNQMPDNICLDGEITLLNPGSLKSKDQYKQTMKITRADGEKHGVKMLVFDYMPAEMFRLQSCNIPYSLRREKLNNIVKPEYKYFTLLPVLYCGKDTSQIKKWLDYNVDHGEEGIMLNVLNAPYTFDRCWDLQKVKKMQTLDLEIVDYFEGKKQFTGMLGGFIVRYKGNNLVRVGSGYDKDFRINAWKNPVAYIGRICEVQYFEETTNQNGGISLRFPVFVDLRTDKTEADF